MIIPSSKSQAGPARMPRGGEVSEYLFEAGLCPSGTQVTDEDLKRGVNVLRRCHKKRLMSDIVWCIIFEKRR